MKTEKTKRRFGAVDYFVVILSLFCALGILLRETGAFDLPEPETRKLAIGMRADCVYSETADCLDVGDELYREDGSYFGRVTELERTPAKTELIRDGQVYSGTPDGWEKVDLRLTVTAEGVRRDGTVYALGHDVLLTGGKIPLYSPFVTLTPMIESVSIIP